MIVPTAKSQISRLVSLSMGTPTRRGLDRSGPAAEPAALHRVVVRALCACARAPRSRRTPLYLRRGRASVIAPRPWATDSRRHSKRIPEMFEMNGTTRPQARTITWPIGRQPRAGVARRVTRRGSAAGPRLGLALGGSRIRREDREDEKAFAERLAGYDSLRVRRDGNGDRRPLLAVLDRRVIAAG